MTKATEINDEINEYDVPYGTPAMDATDVPMTNGRYSKKVVLVCPQCKAKGIYIEDPDTTLKFGDETTECQDCFFGFDDYFPDSEVEPEHEIELSSHKLPLSDAQKANILDAAVVVANITKGFGDSDELRDIGDYLHELSDQMRSSQDPEDPIKAEVRNAVRVITNLQQTGSAEAKDLRSVGLFLLALTEKAVIAKH